MRFRHTMTVVVEYEPNVAHYPGIAWPDDMIALDKQAFLEEPEIVIDMVFDAQASANSKIEIVSEVILD